MAGEFRKDKGRMHGKVNMALARFNGLEAFEEEVSEAVYFAGQAVWWMALYYPLEGFRDWDDEEVKCFQQLYKKNVDAVRHDWEHGEPPPQAKLDAHQLIYDFQDRVGREIVEWIKEIPWSAKEAMATDKFFSKDMDADFGFVQWIKRPKRGWGMKLPLIVEGATNGLHDAYLSAVHTLIQDFKLRDDTIVEILDKVTAVASQYGKKSKYEKPFNFEFIVCYIGEEFGVGIEEE